MPRPKCCRRVSGAPACKLFKPMGVPASSVDEVVLALDEYEALRLADFEGLYQEQAAGRMGVSRQTFGRTIAAARRKVARALVQGCLLRIELKDGVPEAEAAALLTMRTFACACGHSWDEPFGTGRPDCCPACAGTDFHRKDCPGASGCSSGQKADPNT